LKSLLAALQPMLDDLIVQNPTRKLGTLTLPNVREKMHAAIGGVEKASERIAAVLDTLKSFGKTNGDVISDIDVNKAIDEAVTLTRHVLKGRATLTVDVPDALPKVRAAASELSQVFINLIENAAQALSMPGPQARGTGAAEIRMELDRMSPEEVTIAVTDNGPGIDDALQAQIFRPYFTTRAQGEGTGLGLSLSQDIMHRFGGDLSVRSRKGQGASFLVTLKRADAVASAQLS
jgi:C4-dicarboxylate-specific signal transduction histidine kinase